MKQTLLQKVSDTIKQYNMIQQGDCLVVGVSGGPDSVCLLHILNQLIEKFDFKLVVAHINHCIRGESAVEDQIFVESLAKKMNLQVFSEIINVKQVAKEKDISVEEAGRIVRYEYFEKIAENIKAKKIAVGHNKNDVAETILLNLIRGSGMDGLKGIEPVKGNIIRPLIEISRNDIEDYCKENNLEYRIDKTNNQTEYSRNKVRLELIPYIQNNLNPNVVNSLCRTAQIIKEENAFINTLTSKAYDSHAKQTKGVVKVRIKDFLAFDDIIQKRIIRMAVTKINGSSKALERKHVEEIIELARNNKTGTYKKVPTNIIARIEYGYLVIVANSDEKKELFCYDILVPGKTKVPELKAEVVTNIAKLEELKETSNENCCLIPMQYLKEGLCIRNRRNGDIINPTGMLGTKKLKDFFIDSKIPQKKRDSIPLIALENEIFWIIGIRHSNKCKITNDIQEVLVVEYNEQC